MSTVKTVSQKRQLAIKILIIALITISYILNLGIGTLSAPGIGDISIICPLGALATMIAMKTVIPRAVVSLILIAIAILLFARAFCAWACPVPLVEKSGDVFARGGKRKRNNDDEDYAKVLAATAPSKANLKPLTQEEIQRLSTSCATKKGKRFDSRHWILVGAIVSTLVFGWPVFCLICPIGLAFASIILIVNLFATGDVTWSVVIIPTTLLLETVAFRKWCQSICPISAIMSLVGKGNKTFKPTIDNAKCRETAHDTRCGICARVCPEQINPRHPQLSLHPIGRNARNVASASMRALNTRWQCRSFQ